MNVHWPLVQTVPEVKTHTICYVQQHNVHSVPEALSAAPFDGVAEAWFNDVAAFPAMVSSPKWTEVVVEDDKKFLDHSKFLTEEKVDYAA